MLDELDGFVRIVLERTAGPAHTNTHAHMIRKHGKPKEKKKKQQQQRLLMISWIKHSWLMTLTVLQLLYFMNILCADAIITIFFFCNNFKWILLQIIHLFGLRRFFVWVLRTNDIFFAAEIIVSKIVPMNFINLMLVNK